jgi:hypothetical protein
VIWGRVHILNIFSREKNMEKQLEIARQQANWTRYQPGQVAGHYESFFQRANHPTRPMAFWIRYTIFSPQNHPENAVGELWAIYFDGETSNHVALRKEIPFKECVFKTDEFFAKVGDSLLERGRLMGSITSGEHSISWDLAFNGEDKSLFLLSLNRYKRRLPKAKVLVGMPMAQYSGWISVNGKRIEVADWIGSQNHNWGSKHTDHYAWGQVAGFDNHPLSFLEVATARLKIGPFWTPFMTVLVLRHRGEETALNHLTQAIRAKASIKYFNWNFKSETSKIGLEGAISASREAFVGLRYNNPPGGSKYCLNTKIASCELKITYKQSSPSDRIETISSKHRAAFEILTEDRHHGVTIRN